MLKGNLTIKLHEAILTHNTELIGKMDPYAVFKHGTAIHESEVLKGADKTPKWQDCHFDFIIKGINEQIEVEIRDKALLKSDLIGGVSLSVDNLVQNGGLTDQWYDITFKGKLLGRIKNGGRIKISSSFVDFSK